MCLRRGYSIGRQLLGSLSTADRCVSQSPKRPSSLTPFPRLPLYSPPFGRSEASDLETSILKFFRSQPTKAQKLKSICDELRGKLIRDDAGIDAGEVPESARKQLNSADMSAYLNDGVFNTLERISTCSAQCHKSGVELTRHPARLCLDGTEVGIRVIVSPAIETGDWQEFCVRTYAKLPLKQFLCPHLQQIRNKQLEDSDDDQWPCLKRGALCNFLNREISARLCLSFIKGRGFTIQGEPEQLRRVLESGRGESLATVLAKYELKPKDKVLLASAVTRAYWQ